MKSPAVLEFLNIPANKGYTETDHDIARYSILKGNEQIFASKYKLYLPTEEELRAEIEREKLNFKLQFGRGDSNE